MHKNLGIFNAPNSIEFQSTLLRTSATDRLVLLHLLLHIALIIITLLLTTDESGSKKRLDFIFFL